MVKVEIVYGSGPAPQKATVMVTEDGKLVEEVLVEMESQQGADGGFYTAVKLTKKSAN